MNKRTVVLAFSLFPFAFAGYTTALPLHAGATLGWHEGELGLFFVVFGLTGALVQGLVFRLLAPRFGERALVIAGTGGVAISMTAVPFTHSSLALYAWTIPLAFSQGLVSPAASGLVSLYADPSEQGETLGAAQAFGAIGRMFGPEAIGKAYDLWGSLTAFLLAGGVMALAWLATLGMEKETRA